MDKTKIEKIAQTPEDKILLSKLFDKINTGYTKNIPANTAFLSPRELEMSRFLFGSVDGLYTFGGRDEAERKMLIFLPEYMDKAWLYESDSPIVCLRASFHKSESLSHRDFLGAIIGAGIARDCIGDIYVDADSCDFFVTKEIAPYLLQNLETVGKAKVALENIPLTQVKTPEAKIQEISDTVASLRLDNIVSSGFHISRTKATQFIASGSVAIDGLPCEKPEKLLHQDTVISVRGMGKIKISKINGQTKKGRTAITIHRYM